MWRAAEFAPGILQPTSDMLGFGAKTYEGKKKFSFCVEEFSPGVQPAEDSVGIDINLKEIQMH